MSQMGISRADAILFFIMLLSPSNVARGPDHPSKAEPITPCTAEGLTPMSEHLLDQKMDECGQKSLFWSISQVNQDKFYGKSERTPTPEQFEAPRQEEMENCELQVKIEFVGPENHKEKTFHKFVDTTIDQGDLVTLVFNSQHQKFITKPNSKYNAIISLICADGFERKICQQQIEFPHLGSKPILHKSYTDTDNKFKLIVGIECLQQYWVKVLGFTLGYGAIEEFFEEKLDLLNKSDKLNFVKNLTDLKGIFYQLTKQNMGSRIIQKLLTTATFEEVDQLIMELLPNIPKIVTDKYGNYVVQKIFKVAKSQQIKKCLKSLEKNFVNLLMSKEGTFALQGILDLLGQSDLLRILQIVKVNLVELSLNQYGTHFVQKLIKKTKNNELALMIVNKIVLLGIDRHGIVVIKALLQFCKQQRFDVLVASLNSFEQLASSEYGHYLIEELFVYFGCYQLQDMLQYLVVNVSRLSNNQYSSSILRKSLQYYGDYMAVPMINSLLSEGLKSLMQNNSGTFMLHRLIQMTQDRSQVSFLMSQMSLICDSLNCYEKRQKWKKFFTSIDVKFP